MADEMAEPHGQYNSTVTFVINGEQFSLSMSALSMLGSACMLNQMINHAGTSDDKQCGHLAIALDGALFCPGSGVGEHRAHPEGHP